MLESRFFFHRRIVGRHRSGDVVVSAVVVVVVENKSDWVWGDFFNRQSDSISQHLYVAVLI